jgi:hypothetical protein
VAVCWARLFFLVRKKLGQVSTVFVLFLAPESNLMDLWMNEIEGLLFI